jgi:hypothetical protein
MGWLAFLEIAQERYFGIAKSVIIKARKNPIPARTEIYPNRLISKS